MSQLDLIPRVILPAMVMPLHGAVISEDGLYRYILTRARDSTLSPLVICMLNPSVADGEMDDPTVRKVIGFAKRLGYGGIIVVNLYAYRATDPRELYKRLDSRRSSKEPAVDIIGPDNDAWIKHACGIGRRELVLGYGASAVNYGREIETRASRVVAIADELGTKTFAIGVNEKTKTPRHPLMTPYTTPMTEWRP